MDRRTYLAGITGGTTALLAGCSGVLGDEEEPENDEDGSSSDLADDDVPDAFGGEQVVVDFETEPLSATVVGGSIRIDDALSGQIDFVEPATADSPARLVAAIRNDASFTETFYTRRIPFLGSPTTGSTGEHNTIYLAPTAESEVASAAPEAIRDENGRWRLDDVGDDWFPETLTLEPEESVEAVYSLLGHHDRENPPVEAGQYGFGFDDAQFTIAVWPTDEPGPTESSSHEGIDVPSLPNRGDETVETRWFHEATSETAVYLQPDVESTSLPGRIEFDFVNRARDSAVGNPYYWRLYKLVDGTWYPIYPWAWNLPLSSVQPGSVDETTLYCFHGEPLSAKDVRTVGNLGGGRYAYTVGYSVESVRHAALFGVTAPDLAVDIEGEAAVADEGDRHVVTLPNHEDARQPATVTVTRTGSADERVLDEQLVRRPFRALRNSLPLFEPGVKSVEVRTDRGTALRQFGYEEGQRRSVTYEGEAFEATGQLLDGE